MSVFRKLKRAARGEVKPTTAALETLRRTRVALSRRWELGSLETLGTRSARLHDRFARMTGEELLAHFRGRSQPAFFLGFRDQATGKTFQRHFPNAANELVAAANGICDDHSWPLLGFGEKSFGDQIEWRRDPITGFVSPLIYHRDVQLLRDDGSDVRVLWELNRLGHLITLGQAYRLTRDEKFTNEFLSQVSSWKEQNPYGRGPNWQCAMEVALRAMNLLAAFELFRDSPQITEQSLRRLLALFDQHGTYLRNNLEFSYIATSNHYFSDVIGLLWLGIVLPELSDAAAWREFGYREMLAEMDKQVLPDGADFESSTGYHRYVLELLLYSFLLCRLNIIDIPDQYWQKLRKMLAYVRAFLRPDGFAPLIGDSDSGQVMPMRQRAANDHAYLLPLGAVTFNDSSFKLKRAQTPEELLWLFGENEVAAFGSLNESTQPRRSINLPDAGLHILRHEDLYLSFNTSHAGINGRGSHGHNDALSIEVSACGRAFIVDAGTFVYTGDLSSRHKFRSTAYHSTVEVDAQEQNTTNLDMPFVIGDEAKPTLLFWKTGQQFDTVVAEHHGYERLPSPLTHRRTIIFNKTERCWLINDEFAGEGEHEFSVRFHFDAGLVVTSSDNSVTAYDATSGAKLVINAITLNTAPEIEEQSTSNHYGYQSKSQTACWKVSGKPSQLSWVVIPVCAGEVEPSSYSFLQKQG